MGSAKGHRRGMPPWPIHLSSHERHAYGDIVWTNGYVIHLPTCGQAAYVHFARWKATARISMALARLDPSSGWTIGPEGVGTLDALSAEAQHRLRECQHRIRVGELRYAWDGDSGLTPERAYRDL